MKTCKVSVIVPVYNVEDYLDECIESIVNQSFRDIEILLIVGKSSDKSTEKCLAWLQKDIRIKVIEEEGKGLGPARNQGIKIAKGDYIVFVDSDDILKKQYIEKLYIAIAQADADLAECDHSKIRIYTEKEEYVPSSSILGKSFNIKQKLLLGSPTMWKIMTKKELWVKNEILQPFLPAEDFITYPLLLVLAKKVVAVNESLYLYRKERKNSLIEDISITTYLRLSDAVVLMIEEFKKRNLFLQYYEELDVYVRRWISLWLSISLSKLSKDDYHKCREAYINVYKKYFDFFLIEEMLLGSYNLTHIVNKLHTIENPYNRIQFSSLISIVSKGKINIEIMHKNRYRQFMLQREVSKEIFEIIEKIKPKYFFFDLLEERHDIIKINNTYFTKSDALEEVNFNSNVEFEIIRRDSDECFELWKNSCKKFLNYLYRHIMPDNIFMIENYLCEKHGDGRKIKNFEKREDIRKKNKILKSYYNFIKEKFPQISVIETFSFDDYFTDDLYQFGCFPWHLNEWANMRIAKEIEKKMGGDFL